MISNRMIKQILSAVMSLVLFLSSYAAIPVQVLAEGYAMQEAVREYNAANAFHGKTSVTYSALEGEEEACRKEDQRTFRRADGLNETVVYSEPVACETGEGYALIDNTLEKRGEGYHNRASDLGVSLAGDTETEELVKMEAGGSLLSWFLGGRDQDRLYLQ